PYSRRLHEAEAELQQVLAATPVDETRAQALVEEIEHLRARVRAVPFIDTFDLRYVNRTKQPQPSTQAVMFCIMDVSGSMDRARKDLAKRFFTLLYLFLKRNYQKIEVVFIRHHTVAKEVDEQEFFYSRETGGTVVSSALTLMADIAAARYPLSVWNIYAAQASDGDNWHHDSPACKDILLKHIMPFVRYFSYIEITPDRHQSLWEAYEEVREVHPNFAMQQIDGAADIYPVFRELFKRRVS
ncbi:MAG: YeaH/YhbH family protein, partial [Candidatus Competibacter denitrificans]